ncbi:proteic killer suppression protein [Bradyrhizobium diazoefficiens]|jgi:proteic killer suppression protein|nr:MULTISPECIES: type II toxin-antitoxin system RelE/ParE family toxin [Bradyrhizobium]MBR0868356.1 type II toxin-antitoxin system RelE/ParE family toxin [Bradyrhizobium diazoefficiens]MBR0892880.1 type II toxin-antitoxin system RelE/ParE family toxin [Bradyrhizobium diazoefficiens]MBR0924564.1 type II toxin-antitoxin system RelE/ParE family toxin [Bradyrhizobium diazoefficiens]WLA69658.1 type II toxin-antitoxin system RelE/ParE family toxin [Bradyrhizobium diazoefficiens]WLB19845.1 type II to
MAIRSFKDANTKAVFDGNCPRGFPTTIVRVARRKVRMVDAAKELFDLKAPPNNKLHELEKDRKGQHAIWINKQFRVCFVWRDGEAYDVEIVDYHD